MGKGDGVDTKRAFMGEESLDRQDGGQVWINEWGDLCFLRSSSWVPFIDGSGNVQFGGEPRVNHTEVSLLSSEFDPEEASEHARERMIAIRNNGFLGVVESTGYGVNGREHEFWVVGSDGRLVDAEGDDACELQSQLGERPEKQPCVNLRQGVANIGDLLPSGPNYRALLTSAPIGGSPYELQIADNPYVVAMQAKVQAEFLGGADEFTMQAWQSLLSKFGYMGNPIDFFRSEIGTLAPWGFAASHTSFGLGIDGASPELAIAVGDLFNSQLVGTVGLWMTMDTPMIWGEEINLEVGGNRVCARDARAALRHIMTTTYPGEPILDRDELIRRLRTGIEEGIVHTIDRAAYSSNSPDGSNHAGMHGPVRLRIAGKPGGSANTLRVEVTDGSASPDLYALVARDAYFQLAGLMALEAVAESNHPYEFFRDRFPYAGEWRDKLKLEHGYNYFGVDYPGVRLHLQQALDMIKYMKERYSDDNYVVGLTRLARLGIMDLLNPNPQVTTLAEYVEDPRGKVGEIIRNMHRNGVSPEQIALEIVAMTQEQAKFLANSGGVVPHEE